MPQEAREHRDETMAGFLAGSHPFDSRFAKEAVLPSAMGPPALSTFSAAPPGLPR